MGPALVRMPAAPQPAVRPQPPVPECPLAQLPENVLHRIFLLAGPGNSLNLTCRYFNYFFKFEDTGFDANGRWRNFRLVEHMVEMYFLRRSDLVLDGVFPVSVYPSLQKRINIMRKVWEARGHSIYNLEESRQYHNIQDCCEILEDAIALYETRGTTIDPSVLNYRFVTGKVVRECFVRRRYMPYATNWTDIISLGEPGMTNKEKVHWRFWLANKFKDLFIRIDVLSKEVARGQTTTDRDSKFFWVERPPSAGMVAEVEVVMPPELRFIDEIFSEVLADPSLMQRIIPCFISHPDVRYKIPLEYLKVGPRFFQRCHVMSELENIRYESTHVDAALRNMISSCEQYEVANGTYREGMLEFALVTIIKYKEKFKPTSRLVSHLVQTYGRLAKSRDKKPGFLKEDWLKLIKALFKMSGKDKKKVWQTCLRADPNEEILVLLWSALQS